MAEPELIQARMKGAFVADPVEGRVFSCHARVVNLLDEASGLLVSLLLEESDMTAAGILVPRLPAGCAPGEPVRGPGVRVAGAHFVLDGAAFWEGRPAAGSRPDRRAAAWLAAALRVAGAPGGFLGLITSRDDNPFAARARHAVAGGGADALVGLGPGFTPSGDDFVAGALLAEDLGWGGARCLDRGAIRGALGGTTPGGRTLLALSLRGSYPAYLLRFVELLRAASGAAAVQRAVQEAVAYGQTSGTDALLGILWRLGGIGVAA